MLDEQGYFYVVGGRSFEGGGVQQWNDVWRSSISFDDVDAVARTCNVQPPACGVGLRCFPSADTVVAADGSYVSCAACPHPLAQSASGSSSATTLQWQVLVGLFVLLFVVTLLSLVFVLLKVRSSGGSAPIALPASLNSWWAKGSTTGPSLLGEGGTSAETSYAGM